MNDLVALPHAHLGPGGQGAMLDEGVVAGNLVILHPLLHPVLQVVDVDRPLLHHSVNDIALFQMSTRPRSSRGRK